MARAVPVVFMAYDILEAGRRRTSATRRCASGAQRLVALLDSLGAGGVLRRLAIGRRPPAGTTLAQLRARVARARRRRPDAQARVVALRRRPEARRLVEVEDRALHDRRRAHLRAAGQRQARQPAHRLHVRRLGRGRARADRQGLLRAVERGDRRAGSLDPPAHAWSGSGRCATSSRSTSSSSASKASPRSSRHRSGIAVRFPRMLRWRKDKRAGGGRHARERAAAARSRRGSDDTASTSRRSAHTKYARDTAPTAGRRHEGTMITTEDVRTSAIGGTPTEARRAATLSSSSFRLTSVVASSCRRVDGRRRTVTAKAA